MVRGLDLDMLSRIEVTSRLEILVSAATFGVHMSFGPSQAPAYFRREKQKTVYDIY